MKHASAAVALVTFLAAGLAHADIVRTITFDTDANGAAIPSGSILSTQYAAWGVSFSTPTTNAGFIPGTTATWATNTDMTITNSDYNYPGKPTPVDNALHALGTVGVSGWNNENNDPSFKMSFADPVTSISATFYGTQYGSGDFITGIYGFDNTGVRIGTAYIDSVQGLVQTLTLTPGQNIAYVVIVPGTYGDYVSVDNITFTQGGIPAPASALVLAGLPFLTRRNRRN